MNECRNEWLNEQEITLNSTQNDRTGDLPWPMLNPYPENAHLLWFPGKDFAQPLLGNLWRKGAFSSIDPSTAGQLWILEWAKFILQQTEIRSPEHSLSTSSTFIPCDHAGQVWPPPTPTCPPRLLTQRLSTPTCFVCLLAFPPFYIWITSGIAYWKIHCTRDWK